MNKIKVFLIVANLLVGFGIYLSFNSKNKQTGQIDEILIYILSNIDSVVLESVDSNNLIELTKISSDWMITKPYRWQSIKLALSNFQTKLSHFNFENMN